MGMFDRLCVSIARVGIACLITTSCARGSADTAEPASDLPTEVRETRFENGQIRERFHVTLTQDGTYLKHGPYVRYHSNGQKSEEGRYEKDLPQGQWVNWFDNGRVQRKSSYEAGKAHGPALSYNLDGQIATEETWARGVLDGPFSLFHRGKKVVVGAFKAGKADGIWELSDRAGTPLAKVTLRGGKYASAVQHESPAHHTEHQCPLFLDLALGKSSYSQVKLGFLDRGVVPGTFDEKNSSTQGRMVSLDPKAVGLPETSSVTLVFDSRDMLVAAHTTLKRDGNDFKDEYRANLKRLRSELSADYRIVGQRMPFVGDSWVKLERPGCRVHLDAPHLDFTMVANYWLEGFQKALPGS